MTRQQVLNQFTVEDLKDPALFDTVREWCEMFDRKERIDFMAKLATANHAMAIKEMLDATAEAMNLQTVEELSTK